MLNLRQDGGQRGQEARSGANSAAIQKSKKLLRALSELTHRIDEATGKCSKVEDLFSPALVSLRLKLRECSGASIKSDEYISGALDISWRKASYEVLHVAKRLRKSQNWQNSEIAYVKSHLIQSFGFYQYLVLSLQAGLDFDHETAYGYVLEGQSSQVKKKQQSWKEKVIFKCLMYMGDLTRYQLEFVSVAEGQNLAKIAKKYYLEALSVDQNQGQPFNQLAALSGSQCHGIIAVYYYLRCLTSEQKFEGAEGNLKKILDKASNSKNSSNENINKQMIVSMMALFQNLLYEDSTKNLSNLCRRGLEQVINSLYQENQSLSSQASTHLILSLLLVKEKSSSNNKIASLEAAAPAARAPQSKKEVKVAMINAFLLAWLTHLTTKILADLHSNLFGPDAVMEIFEATPSPDELIVDKKDELQKDPETDKTNGHTENNKKFKRVGNLRRRRRLDSENDSENDSEDDADSSEFVNGDFEDSDSDLEKDPNAGSSDEDDKNDDFIEDSDDYSTDDDDIVIEDSKDIITVKQMMKLFANHPMLESFQLCCQWLMTSKQIIQEAGENSHVLWHRLTMLLNTLSPDNEKYEKLDADLEKIRQNDLEKLKIDDQKMAFSEDKIARGMRIFEQRQKKLDFETAIQYQFDQIALARLQQTEELKLWLCKLPQTGFKLTQAKKLEFNPNLNNGKVNEFSSRENSPAQQSDKATAQLMENMAQLWLQQEVKDLEGHETKGKYSPYLVVDHMAMINHMFAIKDIVASKKFAVIVPNAVVQQLDAMKKLDGRARNAIRWLEKQFQHGNRWLRGQKPHESKSLDNVVYPRRGEKDSWHFFMILECCNHFLDQGASTAQSSATASATTSTRPMAVTLITANGHEDSDLMQVPKSKGINVETVEELLKKCNIPKKRGGKKKQKENG